MATPAKKAACLSVFGDKSACPTDVQLRAALGPAAQAWSDLVAHCSAAYSPLTEQWNHAGKTLGWALRLKQGDRIVLYLIPQRSSFLVGLVLGAKAVAAVMTSDLPAAVVQAVADAPKYAEGTGLRIPVADRSHLSAIKQLAALKMTRWS